MASGKCPDRLPLVQADVAHTSEWLSPAEITEAFRLQQRFVRPDFRSIRVTLLGAFLPGLCFMVWLLTRQTGPGDEAAPAPRGSWSCGAVFCAASGASAVIGFVAAACRTPGVVPRAPAHGAKEDVVVAAARYVTINGAMIRQRWCQTCRVYRPLRAKHCSYCDRCVFRFDHHCQWLGNCIGLGNYRSFLFLISATALFFGTSAVIAMQVVRADVREVEGRLWFLQALRRIFHVANVAKSVYVVYAFGMFLAFFVLITYHALIIGWNMTTNEHVRDYYLQRNPFDISCMDNYRQVFCCPYGRTLPITTDGSPSRSCRA